MTHYTILVLATAAALVVGSSAVLVSDSFYLIAGRGGDRGYEHRPSHHTPYSTNGRLKDDCLEYLLRCDLVVW